MGNTSSQPERERQGSASGSASGSLTSGPPLRRASTANTHSSAAAAVAASRNLHRDRSVSNAASSSSPGRRMRSRSGSVGLAGNSTSEDAGTSTAAQGLTGRIWRSRGVSSAGVPTGASSGLRNQAKLALPDGTLGMGGRKKSIELAEDESEPSMSRATSLSRKPPGTLSPQLLGAGGFDTSRVVSPYPSPSVATVAQHASGTSSHQAIFAGSSSAAGQPLPVGSTPQAVPGSTAQAPIPSHALFTGGGESLSTAAGTPTAPDVPINASAAGGGTGGRAGDLEDMLHPPPSIEGRPTADPLGRKQPAALPSYLKIPTLIPSTYASPTQSLSSSPTGDTSVMTADEEGDEQLGHHRHGTRETTPTAGAGLPGFTGQATAGASTAQAVLNTEDVVLGPGTASKVSSPVDEVGFLSGSTGPPTRAAGGIDGEAIESGPDDSGDLDRPSRSSEPSGKATPRSQTPTPGNVHSLRVLTPSEAAVSAHESSSSSSTAEGSRAAWPVQTQRGFDSPAQKTPTSTGLFDTPPASHLNSPSAHASGSSRGGTHTPSSSKAAALGAATASHQIGAHHHAPHFGAGGVPHMPIVVTWRGGGKEVFVTGTFANEWRSKILLKKTQGSGGAGHHHGRRGERTSEHSCVLHLPPGTHRLKFIVDDRWRVSRDLATATDGDGNLVNYVEIPNVGPAHPGPLSAPGEDLPEEARRAGTAASTAPSGANTPLLDPVAMAAAAAAKHGRASHGTSSAGQAADGSTAARITKGTGIIGGFGATMDLQEEARRAEALRRGDLQDVFGEDTVRAAEKWTRDIPAAIIKAQAEEEAWRDELEAKGIDPADAAEGGKHHRHHSHSQHAGQGLPLPPALPRQLEKVILNSSAPSASVDDNSVLPAPNHVVLNHLTASAIKAGVLAVGTTTRYKRKYATIVYHRPVG